MNFVGSLHVAVPSPTRDYGREETSTKSDRNVSNDITLLYAKLCNLRVFFAKWLV